MFAGKIHPTKYIHSSARNSAWSTAAGAEHENDKSGGTFYEHCLCDGSAYGPHEFSNSNCTGSGGVYGVWKVNKFWSGCTKYLSIEFRISSE